VKNNLKEVFSDLKARFFIKSSFEDIKKIYNHKSRHYHNLSHIENLISLITIDADKYSKTDIDALYLAAFYHDIVYDVRQPNNEELSVSFFESDIDDECQTLELNQVCSNVKRIIISTKKGVSNFYLANIFNFYDRNVIYSEFNELVKWEDGIRKEYCAIYTPEIYKIGRIKFLSSILEENKYVFNGEQYDNIISLIDYVKEYNIK
jgi:predicted metal-dependent HD superfamily phosphohydrolase